MSGTYKKVSKDAFYAVMNPLDVHPRVQIETLRQSGHVSIWEMRNRQVVGRSTSHASGPTHYELITP